MRRGVVLGAGAVAALVAAVLLVRPGTAGDGLATTAGSEPPAVVAEDPRLSPDALLRADLPDLPVTATGIGPLRLGEDVSTLTAAGWADAAGGDGCLRLGPTMTADAVLTGWALAGRLASVQVEAVAVSPPTVVSEVGFTFGEPVGDASAPDDLEEVTLGPSGVPVGTAAWRDGGTTVRVSDLGTAGVRHAEVATAAGAACRLDPALLGAAPLPTELLAVTALEQRLRDGGTGHRYLASTGATVDQVASVPQWSTLLRSATGRGCETVERRADGDTHLLFLRDGVVVGEQFALDTPVRRSPDPAGSQRRFVELPGERLVGVLESAVAVSADGVPTDSRLRLQSEVVPALDAVVVTDGPYVADQLVGQVCLPSGDFSAGP